MKTQIKAAEAFDSRQAEVTVAYQNELITRGPLGQIAFGLFRAQKRSTRAKEYRRHSRDNYAAKNEALVYLDCVLSRWSADYGIAWGWQTDPGQEYHSECLYVDLPMYGQASFHALKALSGQVYSGRWSGEHNSREVILLFCDSVIEGETAVTLGPEDVMLFGKHVGKKLKDLDHKYCSFLREWEGIGSWPCLSEFLEQMDYQA